MRYLKALLHSLYILMFLACGESDTTQNKIPIANAGVAKNVKQLSVIILDASKSSDSDLDMLEYSWTILSKPDASTLSLLEPALPVQTFVPDKIGSYKFALKVYDGHSYSLEDEVIVNVVSKDEDSEPTADAGKDFFVKVGSLSRLDASSSIDADGDGLSYSWSLWDSPQGSSISFEQANKPNPTFTIHTEGKYVFALLVTANGQASSPSFVEVMAVVDILPPLANAGYSRYTNVNKSLTLDASKSFDAQNETISYLWKIISKPISSKSTLADINTPFPSFMADQNGSYIFALRTTNSKNLHSKIDTILIQATDANLPPTADAGNDCFVKIASTVKLDGSKSIDTTSPINYNWTFVSKPQGSKAVLADSSTVFASFVADISGTYLFSLKVDDGTLFSKEESVMITATSEKLPPLADAGDDKHTLVGNSITLNSPNINTNLDYMWHLKSKPARSGFILDNNTNRGSSLEFTADTAGTYIFDLVVMDSFNSSKADSIVVRAYSDSIVAIADAGLDRSVLRGSRVMLSNNATDTNATCSWHIVSRPNGSLVASTLDDVCTKEIVTDKVGIYIVELTLNKNTKYASKDILIIESRNLLPVADAGKDIIMDTQATATLDGMKSYDDGGDKLSYRWRVVSKPSQSTVNIFSSSSKVQAPSIKVDFNGEYVFGLIVNDGIVDSIEKFVTVDAVGGLDLNIKDKNGIGYKAIPSPYTNKIWLDRNLGASRACTSTDDKLCYGGYFQWGRGMDGHEILGSLTTSNIPTDIYNPGDKFVLTGSSSTDYRYDWGIVADNDISIREEHWTNANHQNQVCPKGFRVPKRDELLDEVINDKLTINDKKSIENHFLKLPLAGRRSMSDALQNQQSIGYFWTTDYSKNVREAWILGIYENSQAKKSYYRFSIGFSVRCIKD